MGFMSAFVKASAYALTKQPTVNAVIEGQETIYRDFVDISVAVATPKVKPSSTFYSHTRFLLLQYFWIRSNSFWMTIHELFSPRALSCQFWGTLSPWTTPTSRRASLLWGRKPRTTRSPWRTWTAGPSQSGEISVLWSQCWQWNIPATAECLVLCSELPSSTLLSPPSSACTGSLRDPSSGTDRWAILTGLSSRLTVCSQVVIRPMMYIALTYDHRLVDGREAVTFLR